MKKLQKRKVSAFLGLFALLGLSVVTAVAFGDNIRNSVVENGIGAGGTVTLTEGQSVTVPYWIQATGSDDCDAADGSSATVTINTPDGVTANPSSLNFAACGDNSTNTQSVEFTPDGPGTYVIPYVSVSDDSGSYNEAITAFRLVVTASGDEGGGPDPDTTPPTIDYTLNPAAPDGDNGWYKSDVSLAWTVTELESPLSLLKTGCDDQNITSDQQETTYSCSASSDGGSAGPVDVKIKRDATAPVVTVTNVSNGGQYEYNNNVPVAGCDTQDATSGVATSATLSGGGVGPGSHTASCDGAKDNAGNTGSASATYDVFYARDGGIRQPINADNTSVFSRGRAVPVKFGLNYDEPAGFDTSAWTVHKMSVSCAVSASEGALESVTSNTPSSLIRYDTTADQYVYNADFKQAAVGSCWKIAVDLHDGSPLLKSAVFRITK